MRKITTTQNNRRINAMIVMFNHPVLVEPASLKNSTKPNYWVASAYGVTGSGSTPEDAVMDWYKEYNETAKKLLTEASTVI
jgi:hypothetical protein